MKKRWGLISLLLVLMVPVVLLGSMNSASGSRWLLQTIFSNLPTQVSVKQIDGRLLERIELSGLLYQSAAETVAINKLVFAWQPGKLFSGSLKIVELTLTDIEISLTETTSPAEPSSFDLNAELLLPIDIAIDSLLVTNLKFQQGEQQQVLQKLHLSAFTEQGLLHLVSLELNAPLLAATANGQMTLGKGFPFNLTTDSQGTTEEYGVWQALTTVSGDMQHLTFDNQVSSPFLLSLKGSVDDLQHTPRLTVRGEWQNLTWPLAAKVPQASSEQGSFELTGLLSDYRLTLNADLTRPTLPKARLAFTGTGSTAALSVKKLELSSTAGAFQLGGDISWKDATTFDLTSAGQNFNPAILLPELPGSLSFSASLKGQMAESLKLDAAINQLSGQLRGYPLSANGKLMLDKQQLTVDAVQLVSGGNKIAVNGTLGQEQTALKFDINAPALESLWPNLGGSLMGKGQVQGAWKNPSVKFQANGKRLRYAEHSARQLDIDIDYRSDGKTRSKIQLSASAIKSGATEISKLLLDGFGTLAQHDFKLDIASSYGEVASALSGSLKDEDWQGEFSKLNLKSKDFGPWRLLDKLAIRVSKSPAGLDLTLAKNCLIQQQAALCTQGHYPADGDYQFQAEATSLPLSLIQAYLPEQLKLTGTIDAAANLQQQNRLLTGTANLAMPANTKVLVQTEQGSTEYALGAASLSGKLKGTMLSADFDLALLAQDFIRGQLQFDTGLSQALSAQITASMLNFALLKPFVPQLTDIKGALRADLAVQGTLAKPVLNGTATLKQGAMELVDSRFALRDINLQASAEGGRSNRLQLQGSAVPFVVNKPEAPETLQLNALLKLDADIQQQYGLLAGHYRLDLPAKSNLSLKTPEAETTIAFGASSLSGTIDGDIILANLDVALAAEDYLRAQVQLDTGKSQALSGKITAAVAEFALLNPFVPQLSNIKGSLKADLGLQGSTEKPVVNGAINLNQGSVDLAELGLKLHDITLQAQSSAGQDPRFLISGSAKSGQGAIKLEGYADLKGTAELKLDGADFEVAKLPEAQITVSPALKLAFADRQGKVTGQLKIPKAILELKEIPENAVQVSPDEVILGEEKTEKNPPVAVNLDADIDVELGKQVRFSGQGFKTNLNGKLKIVKTGDKMTMNGQIDMDKAQYKSYGQELTVRKGRFLFNGPIEKPWLDVEAIRVSKDQQVTAILSLTGSLDSPQTHLSSEPGLPEAEVLAYLVTGGPLNQVSQSEGNRVASAAISYGAGQVSWIADKLGVDEFEVKEGKTLQDTLASVGQYLTPDFYVGTKVGLFNKQAVLVLKHKLTKTLNVETQTGTSQRIKLNYELDTD